MTLYGFTKRLFDFCAALAGLLAISPLALLVILLIKLEDGGPVFYRQLRLGHKQKPFWMLKFRTMRQDADKLRTSLKGDQLRFKMRNDPRITRVGRFLRRFSLDELPQLINVLLGEMSIVGPRPPLPEEVRQYESRHLIRMQVPQGLTCYWQIMGRSELDFEQQVDLDKKYICEKSFTRDLGIVLKTIPAVLAGRGAY